MLMMISCHYMLLQLQGLIHLALENMTSLFGSLTTTVDEMIPSLRKLRKLAGMFSEGHHWPLIDAVVLFLMFLFSLMFCALLKKICVCIWFFQGFKQSCVSRLHLWSIYNPFL
jgi:hypothetical protein